MLGKYFTVNVATQRNGIDCTSTMATPLQDSFRLSKMEVIKLFSSHWLLLLSFLHLNILCLLSEWENTLSSCHWGVPRLGVPGFFVPYSKN